MRSLVLAFCLIAAAALSPARAAEQVLSFDSAIAVGDDDGLTVVETIAVQVEGIDFKRGLIRTIPIGTAQAGLDGGFQVTSVTRNGQTEPFTLDVQQGIATIRIGSADVLVPHGEQAYAITYRIARQVDTQGQSSALAWNVTGHDWMFVLPRVTAAVTLPSGARASRFKVATGVRGRQAKDATVKQDPLGVLVFESKRPFQPREGMTVFIDWVKPIASGAPK